MSIPQQYTKFLPWYTHSCTHKSIPALEIHGPQYTGSHECTSQFSRCFPSRNLRCSKYAHLNYCIPALNYWPASVYNHKLLGGGHMRIWHILISRLFEERHLQLVCVSTSSTRGPTLPLYTGLMLRVSCWMMQNLVNSSYRQLNTNFRRFYDAAELK